MKRVHTISMGIIFFVIQTACYSSSSNFSDKIYGLTQDNLAPKTEEEFFGNYFSLLEYCAKKLAAKNDGTNLLNEKSDVWRLKLTQILTSYPDDKQLVFLRILKTYLDNRLPGYSLFQKIKDDPELLSFIHYLTLRYLLWTREGIEQLYLHLSGLVRTIKNDTGEYPDIVEVAAGYGDLSYGLKQLLHRDFPDLQIHTTDALQHDETFSSTDSNPEFDFAILKERGVRKFDLKNIQGIRDALGIQKGKKIIVLAGFLPINHDVEKALYDQTEADYLYVFHSVQQSSNVFGEEVVITKTTGDIPIYPNMDAWDFELNPWDLSQLFNGIPARKMEKMQSTQLWYMARKSGGSQEGTKSFFDNTEFTQWRIAYLSGVSNKTKLFIALMRSIGEYHLNEALFEELFSHCFNDLNPADFKLLDAIFSFGKDFLKNRGSHADWEKIYQVYARMKALHHQGPNEHPGPVMISD